MRFIIHVSVVLEHAGRVALVREAKPGSRGKWNLPGGHLEPGEELVAGALRELREETGQVVPLTGLLGVYTGRGGDHALNFLFTARTDKDALAPPADELLGAAWFTPEEIRELPDAEVLNPRKLRRILSDFASCEAMPLDRIREDVYGAP